MISRFAVTAGLAACLTLCMSASAAQINIILNDVDLQYGQNGTTGRIDDVEFTSPGGGNLDPQEADPLEAVTYELGGQHVLSQVKVLGADPDPLVISDDTRQWIDVNIAQILPPSFPLNSYETGVGNSGGGFGVDLFTSDGYSLRLGIDTIDMIATPGVWFWTATATLLSQDLPGNLMFVDDQITLSYTATLPALPLGSTTTDFIGGSGAMTISGEGVIVPEPGTVLLSFLALTGSAMVTLRRRWG
ncbi:PEP-CTERM sorting domain-containing protein [Pseudobythopirellula maris]|nr:PEP-CTERM sorting domain-containing protein [Pseudobythopirellula maris]